MLKRIELPAGEHPGLVLEWEGGWVGSGERHYREGQYDGFHVVGAGKDHTTIVPPPSNGGSTIMAGVGAGTVKLEGLTVVGDTLGKGKAIHCGTSKEYGNSFLHEDDMLVLRDVRIMAPTPGNYQQRPHTSVWGVMTYNFDIDWRDVDIECRYTAEHGLYAHGFARFGLRWDDVRVKNVGAEGLKVATRPEEVHATPRAQIWVSRSMFRNWKQPHSWRGGAGMVLQGTGCRVIRVEDTVFHGRPKATRCLMIDDGGARHYDIDGVPYGPGFANGWVLVKGCGFVGQGEPYHTDILKVDTLDHSLDHAGVARGFWARDCGSFGPRTLWSLHGVKRRRITRCNDERAKRLARDREWPLDESRINTGDGPLVDLSEGIG